MIVTNRVLNKIRNRLDKGEETDLADLLKKHPELKLQKSFVLEMAHNEYCRRLEAGESIDADDFCGRFPSFQNSLFMVIELNRLLSKDSAFQKLCKEPDWPEAGESFLDYSLIAELGRGSFAHVFLASEPALGGRLVVLKIAPSGGEEAEVVGKLRHPNIVPVHSIKEDPQTGLTAICMPYLGRSNLCDVLDYAFATGELPTRPDVILQAITELHDDPKLTDAPGFDGKLHRGSYVEAIIHLAVQIVDALSYTHARGICHLDMKPSNVLLSTEGRPLLLDFNLSIEGETDAWKIGGTLPYMSPEQLHYVIDHKQGASLPPDPRSDLFSFGIIVYQLLSGELPFGQIPRDSSVEKIAEKLLCRQEKGPLRLREKNPRVDKSLAAIVESCLAFDPDQRPQSAQILAEKLRKQLAPIRRARRWTRNHPRRVLFAASVVFTVFCVGVILLAMRAPYSIRQFQLGQYYAEQGQYRMAAECLDRSIEANPEDVNALFARGRVRQKLGRYALAVGDFHAAADIRPDSTLFACIGYCYSRRNYSDAAITYYNKAIGAGFRSPGLFNNLGHNHHKMNRLDEAEWNINKALEMAPDLQAAHNNKLALHVQRSNRGMPITESVLMHAKNTVETASPSGDLYLAACLLFGPAGHDDPRWRKTAIKYIKLAIEHHYPPKHIAGSHKLSYLCDDPELKALLDKPPSKEPVVRAEYFVDPVDDSVAREWFAD
ncbi:MAG: tetratricopeptide repeat protein [Pirellulales bacterium]|nr:tetratricopeptide repeat protein [Pirellulales bacterium]